MKVTVQEGERTFSIPVPFGVMCSPPVLCCASGFRISWTAASKLRRELSRLRREKPDWALVEVLSADGAKVTITL